MVFGNWLWLKKYINFFPNLLAYSYKIIFDSQIVLIGWALTGLTVNNSSCSKSLLPQRVFFSGVQPLVNSRPSSGSPSALSLCHATLWVPVLQVILQSPVLERIGPLLDLLLLSPSWLEGESFIIQTSAAGTNAWENIWFRDSDSKMHH